jgi:hypothetical protein
VIWCRDGSSTDNNTRNAAARKVQAGLFIYKHHPPAEFPRKEPMNNREHFIAHDDCLALLGTAADNDVKWDKSPPNTAAQAYTFHYYVLSSPDHVTQNRCVDDSSLTCDVLICSVGGCRLRGPHPYPSVPVCVCAECVDDRSNGDRIARLELCQGLCRPQAGS